MGITKYPLQDAGFIITPYIAAYINLSIDTQQNLVPDSIQTVLKQFDALAKREQLPDDSEYHDLTFTGDNMPDSIKTVYHEGFDGNCQSMFPKNSTKTLNRQFYDENLLYIPLQKQAYTSDEEIMAEIKTLFKQHGIQLPKTLDWWRYIVTITGRYFC